MDRRVPSGWLTAIVATCQNGDDRAQQQAWHDLVEWLLPHIKVIAIRAQRKSGFRLRSVHIAEDAMMEALTTLYKNIHKITDPTGLLDWFAVVIQNKLRDLWRKQYVQREITDEDVGMFESGIAVASADHLELYVAINTLRREKREVLYYAYWLGLPLAEISELLGVPLGTVKSRLSNAYRELRKALNQ